MSIHKLAVTFAAFACASDLAAQTSNCMNMGDHMVHCDNMGSNGSMSSTNCLDSGGGMTNCHTMQMGKPESSYPIPDVSSPNTSGSTLSFIGGLIAQSQERALRKKLGQMISGGDCQGAVNLALSKGRYDMSSEIRRFCVPKTSAENSSAIDAAPSPLKASGPLDLEGRLRIVAARANAATPTSLDESTTATKVEAIGTQILITARVRAPGAALTDTGRASVINQICANPSSPELLKAGASIRIKYYDANSNDLGSVMVTRSECGL